MPDAEQDEDAFTTTAGPVRIDWPRALGYYGAVGAAVAFELIAPPLGVFIALMPLVKLLKREHARWPERFLAAIIEGAGKPVGGDAEGVVRPTWMDEKKSRSADAATALASSSPEKRSPA